MSDNSNSYIVRLPSLALPQKKTTSECNFSEFETSEKSNKIKRCFAKNKLRVIAPKILCIFHNLVGVVSFLQDIIKSVEDSRSVHIDFSAVKNITPDVAILIISVFDSLIQKDLLSNRRKITCYPPVNDDWLSMLISSKFFNFVKLGQKGRKRVKMLACRQDKLLEIKSDSKVQPEIADEVVLFAKKHLNKTKFDNNSQNIYATIIECMANTKNHAYINTQKNGKWWLMAEYNKYADCVHFSFFDRGVGIPYTIRKRLSEQVIEKFNEIIPSATKKNDGELIHSTLRRDINRTRTREFFRGKGLPKIYNYANRMEIESLLVMSNFGYVTCGNGVKRGNDSVKNVGLRVHGTLLSWNFL